MLLGRRDFLIRTGLFLGATGLGGVMAGCDSDAEDRPLGAATGSWEGIRAQFELERGVRHFAAFLLASHPRPVREAIERHRRGLDADPSGYLHDQELALEGKVVEAAAAYLGASAADFALTDSTTMGLGLLYAGVRLSRGQEILTTEHDFYSTHEALRVRAARSRASLRRIRLYDDPAAATADEIVARLADAVSARTRVLALTWVHSSTGVKLPLAAIAAAVADRRRGDPETRLLLCVDAVHALGAEEIVLDELGCDFFVSGCHKWLFGPRGTGVVWGADEAWQACEPTIPSFTDNEEFIAWLESRAPREGVSAQTMTPGGFHSFEHRWALAEAFDFQRSIGMSDVARRTRELAARLKDGLRRIAGVTIRTPAAEELSAGLVCFELSGRRPEDVVEALRERGVVSTVTPYAQPYVRFGTTVLVSEDDVDQAVSAVGALARSS
jgi:isopenicillin-N epimerase